MNNLENILNHDIILIIECCKTSQDSKLIEEKISLIKDWDEFISTTYSHGVFPLVYLTLKKYEDKIPSNILNYMKSIYMDIVKYNMLLTSELIKIMKILEENDIKAIAFKGPTLAQLAYGNVTFRQYVDLDVLIDEKNIEKAYSLLCKTSYSTDIDITFLTNKLYIDKNSDIQFFNKEKSVLIELHWKLFRKQFYSSHIDYYIEHSKSIDLNNYSVNIFSNEILLVYLCMHGSKHCWERIEWIADIDKLIRIDNNLDWSYINKYSKKESCLNMVKLGLLLSSRIFNTPIPIFIDYSNDINFLIETTFSNYSSKIIDEKVINNFKSFKFHFYLNDSYKLKMKFLIKTFISLKVEDILYSNISERYYIFYLILRPIRLIKKYLK